MIKRVVFRHMEHSKVIEEYANQQLEKVIHFLENEPTPIYIDLIFEPSLVHEHHRVELLVKSPHYDLVSHYEFTGTGFYDVIDRVIDTMYHELHEKKRKNEDMRKMRGRHEEFKKQR